MCNSSYAPLKYQNSRRLSKRTTRSLKKVCSTSCEHDCFIVNNWHVLNCDLHAGMLSNNDVCGACYFLGYLWNTHHGRRTSVLLKMKKNILNLSIKTSTCRLLYLCMLFVDLDMYFRGKNHWASCGYSCIA